MSTTAYVPTEAAKEKILSLYQWSVDQMASSWNIRERLRAIDLRYAREMDMTEDQLKARLANKLKDPTKFQNIEIPVVMPQVETAVGYQQSVFLQGHPIFSAVSHPEFSAQASQIDTIFAEQEVKGHWRGQLIKAFRDGFKYNLMGMEVQWAKETVASMVSDLGRTDGNGNRADSVIWQGNKLRRMDLYNTFFDARVSATEIAEFGEFCGYNEILGRVAYKKFIHRLSHRQNIAESLVAGTCEAVTGNSYRGYYLPDINQEALLDIKGPGGFDWGCWAGYERDGKVKDYKNAYLVTTFYARIIPEEMGMRGVPGPKTPQVWKFIIVNGATIIFCERCTNAHDKLPIVFGQPLDDGLGYQTKSFAQNIEAFQAMTTALANSTIASRRRAISDRKIFDPSRISPSAINNPNPDANIPVRPSAYGRNVAEAVYAFPFRDDQFQINSQELQFYMAMADKTSGHNPARQGQFVKGNKTRYEYADVMSNANGRDQLISIAIEEGFLAPIKDMLLLNVLQYQSAGSVTNPSTGEAALVNPVDLRKAALVMKVSDGLSPSDKLVDGETLSSAIQLLTQMPEAGSGFNVPDMVTYLFESRGLKLATFRKSPEQQAYEQAVGEWQQALGMLIQELQKTGVDPNELAEALKNMPQPTPEQYNYTPGKKSLTPGAATTDGSNVVSEMTKVIQDATAAATQPTEGAQDATGA